MHQEQIKRFKIKFWTIMYSIAAALTQWLVFLKPQKTSSGLQRSQHKSAAAHRNRFHFLKDLTLLLRVYFEVCYLFRKRFKNRSTDQCLSWKKKKRSQRSKLHKVLHWFQLHCMLSYFTFVLSGVLQSDDMNTDMIWTTLGQTAFRFFSTETPIDCK